MKYYLDTSAIYHIKSIPERILTESFYSSFAILELVAGITAENFQKRKSILRMLKSSVAIRDSTFPDQLIFESFDSFNHLQYKEERIGDLVGIMESILNASDFEIFQDNHARNIRKFDLAYFIWLDNFLTDNFYHSGVKGNNEIREALEEAKGGAFVKLGGKKYELSSRRAIADFLKEPLVNSSFTIIALANAGIGIVSREFGEFSEEKVYMSYNGKAEIFITAMSAYSIDQIIYNKNPRRNDFQDLIHLLYMRSIPSLKIISEDTIYSNCIPDRTVSIKQLLA